MNVTEGLYKIKETLVIDSFDFLKFLPFFFASLNRNQCDSFKFKFGVFGVHNI